MHNQFGGFCGWKRIKGRQNHVQKKSPSDDVTHGGWGRCRKEQISERSTQSMFVRETVEKAKKEMEKNKKKEKKQKNEKRK